MRLEKTVLLQAEPSAVWNALTNPELTKKYFFGCEAISDWKIGSPLHYQTVTDGQATVHVKGVIRAFEPGRYLEATCVAAGFENVPGKETVVTYSLTEGPDGTTLHVTQGEFEDEETCRQNAASCDLILAGLKKLVEEPAARQGSLLPG